MKKIIKGIYILLVALFMVMLGSCGGEDSPTAGTSQSHVHKFGDKYKYNHTNHWKECSCGNKINFSQHLYKDWTIISEATENSTGSKKSSCEICGYIIVEEIPKINHTHNYSKEVIAPTCTEKGYTINTCNCGYQHTNNYIDALGHNYKNGTCGTCGNHDPDFFYDVSISEALKLDDNTNVSITGTVVFVETGWSQKLNKMSIIIQDEFGDSILIKDLNSKVRLGNILNIKGVVVTIDGSKQIQVDSNVKVFGHNSNYFYKKITISEIDQTAANDQITVRGCVKQIEVDYNNTYDVSSLWIEDEFGNSLYLDNLVGNPKVGEYIEVNGWIRIRDDGSREIVNGSYEKLKTITVTWENMDGTILEIDYNVFPEEEHMYNGEKPYITSNEQYTYIFKGWVKKSESVEGDTTYVADYEKIINKYTVKWINYDGTILEIDENVSYGTLPEYNGDEPSRPQNGDLRYIFDGWTPEINIVSGDVSYTAQFIEIDGYIVTWKNYDGTILEIDYGVKSREIPSYNGPTPEKPKNDYLVYKFYGWDKEVTYISEDTTYIAQYLDEPRPYSVTWKNYDGTILEIDENYMYNMLPTYDSNTPIKEMDNYYIYEFIGWDKEISSIKGDQVYTAQFSKTDRLYTVTWENYDGTILEIDYVVYNSIPVYNGATPIKASDGEYKFEFIGWSTKILAVTKDVTYTATFEKVEKMYVVTWVNYDGTILEVDNVKYGTMPSYDGKFPEKEAEGNVVYYFEGWLQEVQEVTENITYVAQFWSKNETKYVENISVEKEDFYLYVGRTSTFNYSVTPAKYYKNVIFQSYDTSIATVSGNTITGKSVGKTKVIGYTSDGAQVIFNVYVIEKVSIYLKTLSDYVSGVAGSKLPFLKLENGYPGVFVVNKSYYQISYDALQFKFYSLTEDLFEVDEFSGLCTLKKAGTGIIKVILDDHVTIREAEFYIYISSSSSNNYIDTFNLNSTMLDVNYGESEKISYSYSPSSSVIWSIKFKSSDESIATVDYLGNVKGISIGTCIIEVECVTSNGTFYRYVTINVTGIYALEITSSNITLYPNECEQISVSYYPLSSNLGKKVTYFSENEEVAYVDDDGNVIAVKPGVTNVYISLENGYQTCIVVTVLDYTEPTNVTLSQTSVTVDPETQFNLTVTITPSDANIYTKGTWSSSNESVATVTNGVVMATTPGIAIISYTLENGVTASCEVKVNNYIYPESIVLSTSSIVLDPGNFEVVTATIVPDNYNVDGSIYWVSSNNEIATVENGVILGVKPGSCIVTATTENGVSETIVVIVNNYRYPTALYLSSYSVTIDPGDSEIIIPEISPSNANAGIGLEWISSNENVATVLNGVIIGVNPGSCIVTVTTENGISVNINVTVNDYIYPTHISFDNVKIEINPYESTVLLAQILPSNVNGGLEIEWISSNESIATVVNGVVTGVKPGATIITAKLSNGLYAQVLVEVLDYTYAETVSFVYSDITVRMGQTEFVFTSVSPSNANKGTNVTLSSSNESIAKVDENGIVTPISVGTCYIIATLENGYSVNCSVTVEDYIYAEYLELSETSITLDPQQSVSLFCIIYPIDAEKGLNISWASSETNIATVDQNGLVKSNNPGTCVITVTLENGYYETCMVTVNDISPIIFNAETKENYSNALFVDATKGDKIALISNVDVSYVSTNNQVAYVDFNNNLICNNIGTCVIRATANSGLETEFILNVYDCSVVYKDKYAINNYHYIKNEITGEYDRGKDTSLLHITINDCEFVDGKFLKITADIFKPIGTLDVSNVGVEIYDENGNLLCIEVIRTEEILLAGKTITVIKLIDLTNYHSDDYTHQFTIKIVDTAN